MRRVPECHAYLRETNMGTRQRKLFKGYPLDRVLHSTNHLDTNLFLKYSCTKLSFHELALELVIVHFNIPSSGTPLASVPETFRAVHVLAIPLYGFFRRTLKYKLSPIEEHALEHVRHGPFSLATGNSIFKYTEIMLGMSFGQPGSDEVPRLENCFSRTGHDSMKEFLRMYMATFNDLLNTSDSNTSSNEESNGEMFFKINFIELW